MRLLSASYSVEHQMVSMYKKHLADINKIVLGELSRALAFEMMKDQSLIEKREDFTQGGVTHYRASVFAVSALQLLQIQRDAWHAGAAGRPVPNVVSEMERQLEREREAEKPKGPSPEEVRRVADALGFPPLKDKA